MGSFLHKFLHTDCKDNIQWFSFSAAEVSAQRNVDSMKDLFNSTVLRFTLSRRQTARMFILSLRY
jgi:hypothetical protein